MQILFFTHYFPPEVNAPASRTFEHCLRWARAGHDVTVVTCAPNCPNGVVFDGYRNRFRTQHETMNGINVVRVWTYLAPNAGTVRRIANYVSYMISAVLTCLFMKRPSVIVATSPQFFCGWAGVLASWLKWRPLVLEIRDIWPESISAVGAIRNRPLLHLLARLERQMYRSARHIVAVGHGYRDNILSKVDMAGQVSVIYNGVDLEQFDPGVIAPAPIQQEDFHDKFICSYVGTIGMAHGLEVTLDAARMLRNQGRHDIAFWLVGDGAQRQPLQDQCDREDLGEYVVFAGRQPKESIPAIIARSNACLVHLKGCELFGTVIPSKIFETMALGKPIIMGVRGEAMNIVMKAQAGISMEPDSAKSLVHAATTLADNPELARRLGNHARDFVAEYFNREKLAEHYLRLLECVVDDGAPVADVTPDFRIPTDDHIAADPI